MNERKLFGTDGIRGKANVYPMTAEVATALGRAVTYYFQSINPTNTKPLIIVGKDTRLSCYMLEMAFSSGVCSQGGEVILTGPLPTPGVAFVTHSMRADAGVMISASHNPFQDNGIKIFDAKGFKLPDSVELELERLVLEPESIPVKTGAQLGNAERLKEVYGRYIVHVKSALGNDFDLEGMRIVLDCANGAGYKVTPMMFHELGAEVFPLGITPNGENINKNCGSLHPDAARAEVLKYRADIGVCIDGDGDRVSVIDEEGMIVDGDKLIGLFAKLLLSRGELKKGDTIVGTVMSNLGLELYLKSLGLNFFRTKVGDRYIIEHMRSNGHILGGEPSGHIIFSRHSTTGDGALGALKAIEAIKYFNKPLKALVEEIELFPQVIKNVVVKNKPVLESVASIQEGIRLAEERLKGKGRVLLRYSGTEPLLRVMVEGNVAETVEEECQHLIDIVTKEIG
ncbi:MAG: phosphoglucosamine mutase [Bacteriovorax sp.]|jgi:phosphoglucosamine mutase|nr:phosphoglucosamine mutase [Bacteriovorax sp.]